MRMQCLIYIFYLLVLLIFQAQPLYAQSWKGYSVQSGIHYGKVIKHKSDLLFSNEGSTIGMDVNFNWQTYGRKPWHQWHKYPKFGLSVSFYRFGNTEVLGEAIGLTPNFFVRVLKRQDLQLHFQIGVGLAYLTTTYDVVNNPENNAVSAHLNNLTTFRFVGEWQWQPKWSLIAGGGLTHYSNGASRLPNFGLNVCTFYTGLQYTFKPLSESDYILHNIENDAYRRFGFTMHADLAFREVLTIGGPRYPIYIFSVGATYKLNKVNHLIAGLEYEFNRGVYEFGLHTHNFLTEAEARRRSGRYMFFLADEVLFGDWGIVLQLGTYINQKSFLLPLPVYSRLSIRYYLPQLGSTGLRTYLGGSLKAHGIIAEYASLGLGLLW